MLKRFFYTIIMFTNLTSFGSDAAAAGAGREPAETVSAAGFICALVEQPSFKKLCLHCNQMIEFRSKKVEKGDFVYTYSYKTSIDGTHKLVPLTVVPVGSSDEDSFDLARRMALLSTDGK